MKTYYANVKCWLCIRRYQASSILKSRKTSYNIHVSADKTSTYSRWKKGWKHPNWYRKSSNQPEKIFKFPVSHFRLLLTIHSLNSWLSRNIGPNYRSTNRRPHLASVWLTRLEQICRKWKIISGDSKQNSISITLCRKKNAGFDFL